jgi:glycosyltransferase involved in cell wall biosynthesis
MGKIFFSTGINQGGIFLKNLTKPAMPYGRPMKIGMLAPISWRVPPVHYGPWELITSLLTEGLVDRGLDVTLFATLDSVTRAKLLGICPKGYSEDTEMDPKVWECLHISEIFEKADEFDIIHNQYDFLPLTYSGLIKTPIVTTIHGFSSPKIIPVYEKYNGRAKYVSISNADRSPKLDYIATVHHGIPMELFTPQNEHGDYLLFFGRIHPDKGAAEAVEVAKRTGMKLVIAGIIQDQEYFKREVEPYIDGDKIQFIGAAGAEKRNELLGGAYALLHIINFNEPFGLSVLESMACGTPVIARNRGSMPELIKHGETGFLIQTIDEAINMLDEIRSLDRKVINRHAVDNFSVERMVDNYIRVYNQIISEVLK